MILRLLLACGLLCMALAARAEVPPPPAQVMVMLHLPAPHYRADGAYSGSYANDPARAKRRALALSLAREHQLTLASDWPMPVLGVDCYVFNLPPSADAAQVASLLAGDKRVAWAQPVTQYRTLGAGDPLYPVQPTAAQWRLQDLHKVATGRGMTVAVVDSGVDGTHPELDGQLAARENFVDGQAYAAEPHGTAVAGIIAAHADNGIGIRGVAPAAHVLALRACSEQGPGGARCDSFSLGKALNFAILHKPDIINLSLTGPPDRLLQRLVEAALGRGIRVVGAADPQSADGGFPASWPGVVAVTDRGSVGLRAPGRDVPAPLPGARFGVVSGASYAAAQVSGLLALMGELRPGATIARASTAVDACGAVGQLAGGCVCTCPVALSTAPANGTQAR